MKKILTALIASSLLVTPALAHDRSYRSDRYRERDHTGEVVVPLIIGTVLGAVISSSRDRDYRAYDRYDGRGYYIPSPPAVPEYYGCTVTREVDIRGNIYYSRVCR